MNRVLNKLRSPVVLRSRFDHRSDMVSLEQIANFELLLSDVIERKVPGAVVELGCYMGSTAAVFGTILKNHDPARPFHVYDRFDIGLDGSEGIRGIFEKRMRDCQVPMPIIHAGDILDIVPEHLPEAIAFAHLDLGVGGDPEKHAGLVTHGLRHVYSRLSPGAVLVIMDYHVPGRTMHGNDSNPGTRLAVDAFLANNPEKPRLLYGGACSHAYIRKQ
jgi:O-methyltransferase